MGIPADTLVYLHQYKLYVAKPTKSGFFGETEAQMRGETGVHERPHVWLRRMIVNVTDHCTEVLNTLQDDFADSLTYRGNDYAKLISMSTATAPDPEKERKEKEAKMRKEKAAKEKKAKDGEKEGEVAAAKEGAEGEEVLAAEPAIKIPEVDLQIDKALMTAFPYTGNTFIQRSHFL